VTATAKCLDADHAEEARKGPDPFLEQAGTPRVVATARTVVNNKYKILKRLRDLLRPSGQIRVHPRFFRMIRVQSVGR
jgi:hypothetical protein